MNSPIKPKLLTYLGAIPFLYALALALYGYLELNSVFATELRFARFKSYMVAHTYGAVIVGFLAGIQWGVSLQAPLNKQYFIISNVLALMAWFSLFAFASLAGMALILLAFVLALGIDRHAFHANLIPAWFWQLRQSISLIVIVTLTTLMAVNR